MASYEELAHYTHGTLVQTATSDGGPYFNEDSELLEFPIRKRGLVSSPASACIPREEGLLSQDRYHIQSADEDSDNERP